jgi:hypothetical protein
MLTRSQSLLVNNFFNEGTDVNKKAVTKKPENLFTIMRTRSQTRNKLNIITSYDEDDVPPPPLAPSGLRSSLRSQKYTVDIDFDGASKDWRMNKRSIGNGSYVYK